MNVYLHFFGVYKFWNGISASFMLIFSRWLRHCGEFRHLGGSPGGSVVKNLPANTGPASSTLGSALCWEDPLEKEMAIHSSILAWEIPWTEEPDRL